MSTYRARIYEKYASQFQGAQPSFDAAAASQWGRAYDYYLRAWLPGNKDAAIADLGCGSGQLLHFFKTRGYTKLAGVDISPEQVALARQTVSNISEGNVLQFLEEHPGEFDLITALDIVEHLKKDEVLQFLDCCYAALKPGGRLILQTPNAESPWASAIRYGDFTHEVCFTPGVMNYLLKLCKFEDAESREQGPPLGYSLGASLRYCAWRIIAFKLRMYNLIETGNGGSGVFTRVFLASGRKPK